MPPREPNEGLNVRPSRSFVIRLCFATALASTVAVMTFGADEGGHASFGHGIVRRLRWDGPLAEVPHPGLERHHRGPSDERAGELPHRYEHGAPGREAKEEHDCEVREPEHEEHAKPDEPHRHEDARGEQSQELHEHEQHEGHRPGAERQEGRPHPEHPMQNLPLGLSPSREASGTSWEPDSTPMNGMHFMEDDWTFMVHGNVFIGYDYQSGRRGGDQWLSTNWIMLMADHTLAGGNLGFRTMLSLEPATVGRDGYPLLLQTGESLNGVPLHDTQHPHDLFMELATMYTRSLTEDLAFQVYVAPAGEPALGPTAFMHRRSAMPDPLAPISHHWQDSTHISYGVLTGGLFTRFAKLEGSWFNGREPDENRWDFDLRRLDSYSGRLTVNPAPDWSAQVSGGHLRSPEELEPDVSIDRLTASVTYNQTWSNGGNWATTLAWGWNKPEGERATNSVLLETSVEIDRHHNPFGRFEYVRKSGHDLVLPAAFQDETFGLTDLVLGYVYNFDPIGPIVPGLGFRFSLDFVDPDLEPFYGRRTLYGFMVFIRFSSAPQEEPKEHHHEH